MQANHNLAWRAHLCQLLKDWEIVLRVIGDDFFNLAKNYGYSWTVAMYDVDTCIHGKQIMGSRAIEVAGTTHIEQIRVLPTHM